MFRKFFTIFILFLGFFIPAFASEISAQINNIINSFDFDRDSVVSVSIKNKQTGDLVYKKNEYKYLNPASVLKLFSMAASINALGEDFSFNTAFYKDKNNNLYLKLSADPFLTEADMNELAASLKANYKGRIGKIYIDDSVIDMLPYPDGWTIDDYWPNSPKISPYMVDMNTVKIDILTNPDNEIRIFQKSPYKFSFVNKLEPGEKNNIKFINDEIHNTVNLEGSINSSVVNKTIPVLNPKYFFCKKMNTALNKNGIKYSDKFLFAKVPNDAVVVAEFSRPLEQAVKKTLASSNNIAAEMIFKIAGGKFANETGTTENGVLMFLDYYKNLGLDVEQIKIRDGSGVSRYNALNTDWMTEALLKINFDFEKYLPTGGKGTLSKRMREMADCVWFKTGTLFGTSSLAGVIKCGGGEYVYSSVIMGYNRNISLIKAVEDEIVYEVYRAGENE